MQWEKQPNRNAPEYICGLTGLGEDESLSLSVAVRTGLVPDGGGAEEGL